MNIIKFALERARESSTWAGIGSIAGIGAITITEGQQQAISALIVALINLWQVLRAEGK